MKVQWYLSDAAAEWAREAGRLAGLSAGAFVERLLKYNANELEPWEEQVFENVLQVANDSIEVDWEDE